jgi:hypothetical protein
MSENTTVVSLKLSDMSLDELVGLVQGWGREIDKMREWRAHVNKHIAARLAAGERNGVIENKAEAAPQSGDAVAPGAVIEASAQG